MPSQEPLPISLVAHHAFCPRRAWLEIHGEETDTGQVAHGVVDHTAVDDTSTSRVRRLRAVDVGSDRLAVSGRCDSIEIAGNGAMTVIEHKANPLRRRSHATFAQRVQLALQALCLRDHGHRVTGAAVWFTSTRRRVPVDLDDDLIREAEDQVSATRAVVDAEVPPPALDDDTRCASCSHVSVCLPDEHRMRDQSRRISVSDPNGQILHLTSPGSRATIGRGQIHVKVVGEDPVAIPLTQVTGIVVHGNADVSSALTRETLSRGYPIVWCTWSGRVVGWAAPAASPNGDARAKQHLLGASQKLRAAREIIRAKLLNQAAFLRRHKRPERTEIRRLARIVDDVDSASGLLGIEGRAAALYFAAFSDTMKPQWANISRRSGRPAGDPVNAALNVTYALLLGDVLRAIVACGLDPSGGVLHSPGRNKPALALDLMEELRAPVADSAVVWAINNGEVRARDFRHDVDAVRLTPQGRKGLIAAYERRVQSEFRHPHFGYRVSWRRAMEVQARIFLAYVRGELDVYRPIALR
jgi:CRISPR-associated protein Cas1